MGIYLNSNDKGFREAVRSKIYVDKTGLIAYTNEYLCTKQKYICVSRPRRFSKSMALEMLVAYYSLGCDSAELFQSYEIAKADTFREHLNKYDVIYLNMQYFLIRAKDKATEYLESFEKSMGSYFRWMRQSLPQRWRRFMSKPEKNLFF